MDITLTEKGELNYERVLELTYMFINRMKEGIDGKLPSFIFEENKKMNTIDFDNITKSGALGYANNLSSRLSTIYDEEEIPDILWRPYDLQNFNHGEIMRRLNLLTPDRCIAVFVSKIVEQE